MNERAGLATSALVKRAFNVSLNDLKPARREDRLQKLSQLEAALGVELKPTARYKARWEAVVAGIKELEKKGGADGTELSDTDLVAKRDALTDIFHKLQLCSAIVRSPIFDIIFDGTYSTFEVQRGMHAVRFTLKGGKRNLVPACEEINQAIAEAKNFPEDHKVYLSGNNDLPEGDANIVLCFKVPQKDFQSPSRSWLRLRPTYSAVLQDPRCTGLTLVTNDVVRLACGAFRAVKGFPYDSTQIGTPKDKGDLLKGQRVKTKPGEGSSSIACCRLGIRTDKFDRAE